MLLKKKKATAGLYVGKSSYVYLALEDADAGPRVATSCSEPFPESVQCGGRLFAASEDELKTLFQFIAASIKQGRRNSVSFVVPAADALIRVASMPGLTVDEAKKAFRYEAEKYFPFNLSECVYDLDEIDYPLPDGGAERRFAVSAARRGPLEAIYGAARSCGFEFAAMEPEQTALERAAVSCAGGGDGVYVYAGEDHLLVIFLWNGNGIFYRGAAISAEQTRLLEECAGAVVSEVRASVDFGLSRNAGYSFDRLYLFGPGATGWLSAALDEAFPECRVNVIYPERRLGAEFPRAEGWTSALGAALR